MSRKLKDVVKCNCTVFMKKIHFFSKRSYSKFVLESDFQQHRLSGFQEHSDPSVSHHCVQHC